MSQTRHLLCLYPWMVLGGADKFNLDMLAGLASRGWRSTIVTTLPSTHPWRAAFERVSDDIVDLTGYPPEEYPARLLQLLRSRPIDCVLISNSSVGYNLLPYLRAHRPDVAYVDYCHMEDLGRPDGGYPGMSVARASALDLQIVASHHLKRWMCTRGGDAGRIAVCTVNVDPARWDPARYDRPALRLALGLPQAAAVVLYAGRLEPEKQPLLAASVMRQVVRQAADVYFLVAGDGQLAGAMRGFLRQYGLERRVRMLGAVSSRRMGELLALGDIFFLPSRMEGIALAIYEAMAMGVVPVGAAVGGQDELVTPECGILIDRGPGERDAYTAALLHLLGDPPTLWRMGRAARQRVAADFRLEQMCERMDALLAEARARSHAQPRPAVDAVAALAAARDTIAAARREEAELRRSSGPPTTPRQHLRALYWRLVERGAWWLVPVVEWVRGTNTGG